MSGTKVQLESGNTSERIETAAARKRLRCELRYSMKSGRNTLIEAPTSLGKSHTIATTPWLEYPEVTGGEPVVHLHQTTEARDEAVEASKNAGIDYAVLEGRKDGCPIASGDYDDTLKTPDGNDASEWLDKKCDVEGIAFSHAHRRLLELNDFSCSCDAVRQWRNIPRDENSNPSVDIIHATYPFTNVEGLIENANVVFDEQPTFTEQFERQQDHFRRAFTNLLSERMEQNPTWEAFVVDLRRQASDRLRQYARALKEDPDKSYLFDVGESHRHVVSIGRALLDATEVDNGLMVGKEDGLRVVLDDDNNLVQLHDAPALSKARCVIGLDAHPSEPLWRLNTVKNITIRRVLSPEQRRTWRRHERGLEVLQIGTNANYVTRGWKNERPRKRARRLIEAVHDRHGDDFRSCICSKAIEPDVRQFMKSAGVDNPITRHYGNLRSTNDFESESVGLVLGCIDPGDDEVLNKAALCDLSVEPERRENGNRASGRGFSGPDGDAGEEILEGVRAKSVAQAVGRYARRPDDPNSDATVYVWTNVLPESMVDELVPGPQRKVTEKMTEIDEFVRSNSRVTTTEVVENVSSSRPHVVDVLDRMAEQDVVKKFEGCGANGANVYEHQSGTLQLPVDLSR